MTTNEALPLPATKPAAPALPATSTALLDATRDGLPSNWWLMDEAWTCLERLCSRFAGSAMVPEDFRGNPNNVFVALAAGLPLGLSPLACLQSIAVINGRPTLWGDAPIAQVLAHPSLEGIHEEATGTIKGGDRKWSFTVRRRLRGVVITTTREYSMEDAKTAGLWGKTGYNGKPTPWVTAPDRMLFNRARAFALRDAFADVLKGISIAADDTDADATPKAADYRVVPAPVKVEPAAPPAPSVMEATTLGEQPAPEPAKPAKAAKPAKQAAAAAPAPEAAPEPAPAPTPTRDLRAEAIEKAKAGVAAKKAKAAKDEPAPAPAQNPAGDIQWPEDQQAPVENTMQNSMASEIAETLAKDAAEKDRVKTLVRNALTRTFDEPITEQCGVWLENELGDPAETPTNGDLAIVVLEGAPIVLQAREGLWGRAKENDAAADRAYASLRRELSQWCKAQNMDSVKAMSWARTTLNLKTQPMTFQSLTLLQLLALMHAKEQTHKP